MDWNPGKRGMDWNPCFSRNLNDWELDNVEACFSRLQGRFMTREEKDRVIRMVSRNESSLLNLYIPF